jgi:hypothetical protein
VNAAPVYPPAPFLPLLKLFRGEDTGTLMLAVGVGPAAGVVSFC